MIAARDLEDRELVPADAESAEIERTRKSRTALAVLRVMVVPDPTRVVQYRKQDEHRQIDVRRFSREVQTERRDLEPVLLAVERGAERSRARPNQRQDGVEAEAWSETIVRER